MSDLLKQMMEVSGNEYASVVDDGIEWSDVNCYVDTGVYILNGLLSGSIYGGIAGNRTITLAGSAACGKTYAALSILKTFLDANPKGIGLYFDTECAVTSEMFVTRGIDPKRVAVFAVDTVQKFQHQIIKILDSYIALPAAERQPMFVVLDSLGMLSTSKEMTDTAEGKETRDMTRSQLIKGLFRTISLRLGKAGVPMIVTNHTYKEQGSMYPQDIISGGGGILYSSSTIVVMSKRKDKDEEGVVGNIIRCKLYKARLTKENSEVEVQLNYDTGLNRYYGLLELAEKYGIFKKVSTRYEMPDGSKVFGKQINENPEKYYTKEVLDLLDEAAKKEFMYGSSLEVVSEKNTEEESE